MAAMVVNMKSDGLKDDFDGLFDVTVRTSDSTENVEVPSVRVPILFTIRVRIHK